jgi:hypothetical protein
MEATLKMGIGRRSQSAAGVAILLFSVGCTDTLGPKHGDVAAPSRITGSGLSLSLVGSNVTRYKPIPGEVQKKRFLLQGTRNAQGGCHFSSKMRVKDGDPVPAEWVVEYDFSTCTQIRARGTVPPGIRPNKATASGKGPATATSPSQTDINYSMGDQSSGAVAGANITSEYRWQNWMVAMASFNNTQFRYTLGPDCVTAATLQVTQYWASNDKFYDWAGPADLSFLGGEPVCDCADLGAVSKVPFHFTYDQFCYGWDTFTVEIDSQMDLQFEGGVLYRGYGLNSDDDLGFCQQASLDFQFVFDGWNPPPGQVNDVSPHPRPIP